MTADETVIVLNTRIKALERMLHTCRDEFCWHGNTGKSLSVASYGQLVDAIDAVLGPIQPGRARTLDGLECVEWVKKYRNDNHSTLKAAKDEWDKRVSA